MAKKNSESSNNVSLTRFTGRIFLVATEHTGINGLDFDANIDLLMRDVFFLMYY